MHKSPPIGTGRGMASTTVGHRVALAKLVEQARLRPCTDATVSVSSAASSLALRIENVRRKTHPTLAYCGFL